jgi:excinuclease UvrABC nuclease subunit
MKKFRRTQIYAAKGKTNVKETQGKAGVYMIYSNNTLVYIGSSQSNMYKALLRHFQDWTSSRQTRITYAQHPRYKVSIIQTTGKQAPRLERALIQRMKPRDNPMQYQIFELTPEEKRANEIYQNTLNSGEAPF